MLVLALLVVVVRLEGLASSIVETRIVIILAGSCRRKGQNGNLHLQSRRGCSLPSGSRGTTGFVSFLEEHALPVCWMGVVWKKSFCIGVVRGLSNGNDEMRPEISEYR